MLQISNLSFSYQDQPLLAGLNLTLSHPETVAIIGDNGSGKTTLLRLIAEELRPDEGSITASGTIGFLHQTQEDLRDKSGGERTQIRLAELFRQKPDILLLDEPTNNLDHESKAWLLRNLQEHSGLVLVVSHDRDFLRTVAQKIIHLHDGKAEVFLGDYTSFRERQAQIQHENIRNYEHSQQEKKKLEKQLKIARDRAHKSNRRAYDKISHESRLHYNGQRMAAQNSAGKVLRATQSRLEQIAPIDKPSVRKTYRAKVSANFLHGRELLEVKNLTKHYSKKQLFENLSFEIRTSERLRVSGRNGSGKSTLFQIVLGEVAADCGEIRIAPGSKIGYISQDTTEFDMEISFLEQAQDFDRTEIFRAATTMDFTPQDLFQPMGNLSRGQLTKMAILRLILRPLDLVIIDEITNHLDIRARENIESALQEYQGAILAATHDETFAQEIRLTKEIVLPYPTQP